MNKNMNELFKTQLIDDVLDIVYMDEDNTTMSSKLKQKIRNYCNLDINSNFKRYMIMTQIRRAVIDKQPDESTGRLLRAISGYFWDGMSFPQTK
jgi:hypothetical protein